MCWLGIDICANTLFENTERVEALSKVALKKLLSLAILFLMESSTSRSMESLCFRFKSDIG